MSEPNPDEFVAFIDTLTENAPDDYEPWLFRCEQQGKNPELSYGSWKDESARLSVPEAVDWLKGGGNVGIAATEDDPLINVDVDDDEETDVEDVKDTLLVRSRSRTGFHALYFEADGSEEIPNIPTDDAGEVRARWQYVVAPGSYVPVDDKSELPEDERDMAGYYTVLRDQPAAEISYDELPQVFLDYDTDEEMEVDSEEMPGDAGGIENFDGDEQGGYDEDDSHEHESALFDISARDVVLNEHGSVNIGDRWEAMFHGSETGANMSFSNQGLINCWRHSVAHNGLQALAVLSDYDGSCQEVGTGKKNSNAGGSCLKKEQGAHIWHAWKYAKQNGYIPDDDPVPYSAMLHVAQERGICPITDLPKSKDESLPSYAYDAVLESIAGHDGVNHGRKKTDEFTDSSGGSGNTAEADGGATTQSVQATEPGPETADNSEDDDDFDDWEDIRVRFRNAGDADERRGPKYDAAMQLLLDDEWRNLDENDRLYWYAPDDGIFKPRGENAVRESLTENLEEQYTRGVKNVTLDHVRSRSTVTKDEMGGEAWKIAAENCVVDLKTGDQLSHKPKYEFMSQLGTEHHPDAEAPRFRQFLGEVVPDDDRQKLQEYAGYCLHHWDHPFRKMLFLVGPTGSGKSTFLDAINAMLGEGTTSSLTPQEMTTERFAASELYEKWANIRNDIPKETVENTGTLKEIAAADPLKAEQKYEDPFRFEPTAKHMFAANQLPEAELDDEAFYDRILLIPFPETVPRDERDPNLDEKLEAELPGILNWAIEGLQRLINQGGFTGDRSPGKTADTWSKWGDSVKRFTEECLMETDKDRHISKSEMFGTYLEYCRQENIPEDTKYKMGHRLKELGFEDGHAVISGVQKRAYLGVKFNGQGKDLRDAAKKSGE